jgi:hypothetical protein
MTLTEPQPDGPGSEHKPFQYSIFQLLVWTTITAIILSLLKCAGWDWPRVVSFSLVALGPVGLILSWLIPAVQDRRKNR